MGPGSDGPMGGMGGMEPHHMNGSLGERPRGGLWLREPGRAFAPQGRWQSIPVPAPVPGSAPSLDQCLKQSLWLEIRRGVWGGAGQGGAGAIAACSIRLFFCVPPCAGSGDIDGLPKVSELQSGCVGPPFLGTGVPV